MSTKKPRPGERLTPERRLNDRFSRIAKTKVEIYRDWSAPNLLLLKWKGLRGGGKFWLPHGNSSASYGLVEEHFARLRSGNHRYNDVWKADKERQEEFERDLERFEEDFTDETAKDAVKMAIKRSVTFTSPGLGKQK